MTGRTMFEKIWRAHEVAPETAETPAIMYIDLHLIHEVTSPQAFTKFGERGLPVRRRLTLARWIMPCRPRRSAVWRPADRLESAARQIGQMERNARIRRRDVGAAECRRGIVHVIGPELGLTQPGKTIVCGDSHTSTHGAFGALAFGIGTTEVAHVFATQCLLQRKPRTLAIKVKNGLRRRHGEGPRPRDRRADRRRRRRRSCDRVPRQTISALAMEER